MQYTMEFNSSSTSNFSSPPQPQPGEDSLVDREGKSGESSETASAEYMHGEKSGRRTPTNLKGTDASSNQSSDKILKTNPLGRENKKRHQPGAFSPSAGAGTAGGQLREEAKRSRLESLPDSMIQSPRGNLEAGMYRHQQTAFQRHGHSPTPNSGPLPHAPTSLGSWNMPVGMMQQPMAPEDFACANVALRRNLATLQQQQQHFQMQQQQQHPQQQFGPSSHQSGQPSSFGGFDSLSGTSAAGGRGTAAAGVGGMGIYPNALVDAPLAMPHQPWATDLLLRSSHGGAVPRHGGGAASSAGNSLMSAGSGGAGSTRMEDSLMQLQLLRQQQERIRQLEQLEEEAVMRRQLQLLRQNNNGGGNQPRNNAHSNMGLQDSSSGLHPASFVAFSSTTDALSFRENFFLQQQFQQQQPSAQPFFSAQHAQRQQQQHQQQQQQQWGILSQQQQQQLRQSQLCSSFGNAAGLDHTNMDAGSGRSLSGSVRGNIALTETSQDRSGGSTARISSMGAVRPFRRASSTALSSSMARATPMVGPIAPPVPPPPPISEANYQLPPIEEGETRHYDQRVHVPLAIEEDHNWLSEFQCFVRKQLLQVFRASHQDVKIRVASKKVYFKQVGIRCRYCAHCKPSTRAIRSSAFPSSIRQLYQSFTMMLRDHFGNCPGIPAPLKERFLQLKRNNTQGASDSMRYWISSAVKLGMVDSECGIVLNEQTQAAARQKPPFGTTGTTNPNGSVIDNSSMGGSSYTGGGDHPPRLLVKPEDLETGAVECEFLFSLLTQYQLIRLLPAECIGNRKSLRPGVPGLGCRYCCQAGRMGLSRIFPAKKKQMPTQIQDLHDHIRRCNLCPQTVTEGLKRHKEERDRLRSSASASSSSSQADEKDRTLRIVDDDDKAFIDLLWQRLGHRGELATPVV